LHGINECSRHFQTQPAAVLEAFAREWGFIPTPSLELPSVQGVEAFTDEVGRSGTWNGEAFEGFVVRTTVRSFIFIVVIGPPDRRDARPPYAAGSSFFCEVKFDEPYMMYRLAPNHEGASFPRRGGEPAEEQDGAP
jgi:tRNA ligase